MPETSSITTTKLSLHRKRGSILTSITNFNKIIEASRTDPNSVDIDYVEISLESLEKKFLNFERIQEQLEELDESEIEERERYEISYNKAVSSARKLIRQFKINPISMPQATTNPSQAVSLPQISLPKFDGNMENWASFHDVFCSLIDQNPNLSCVQKLQYLRLSVVGRAAKALEAVETVKGNYDIALGILKRKFECTRRTLYRHYSLLQEYPKLSKDSSSEISNFLHHVNLHLRALRNLNAPVDQWDVPITNLILSKISSNLALQWELTLNNNDLPSYENLIEFLEKRANCSDFYQPKSNLSKEFLKEERPKKSFNRRQQLFVVNSKSNMSNKQTFSCEYCKDNHPIFKCDTFSKLPLEAKQKLISESSLCFNCLNKNHTKRDCWSKMNCRVCHKRHHTLLHKNNETVERQPNTTSLNSDTNLASTSS